MSRCRVCDSIAVVGVLRDICLKHFWEEFSAKMSGCEIKQPTKLNAASILKKLENLADKQNKHIIKKFTE